MRRLNPDQIDWGDPRDPRRWRKLRPEDAAVWAAFLDGPGLGVTRAAFDVLAGPGLAPPFGADEATRRMYAELSRHEIDVIFELGARTYSAELKPRATLAAVGQAYFGTWLLYQSQPTLALAEPAVICWGAEADIAAICREFEIQLWELGPNPAEGLV